MRDLIRDYTINLCITLGATAVSFLLYKLALVVYGAPGLETLTIVRRYQAFLLPIAMLGYGVTLPKYIARGAVDARTFLVILASSFGVLALVAVGSLGWQPMLALSAIFTIPALIGGLYFSVSRGVDNYKKGGVGNLLFLALVPLVTFPLASTMTQYVYLYAVVGAILGILLYRYFLGDLPRMEAGVRVPSGQFMLNSVVRVPGDFFNQGMLLIPVQVLINQGQVTDSSYVALGISIAVAASIPAKPISTILLTKIVRGGGKKIFGGKYVGYSLCLAGGLALLYFLVCPLVDWFYYHDARFLASMRGLTPFVFFNTLYILWRSHIDALYAAPALTYINGLGFLLQLAWSLLFGMPEVGLCVSAFLVVSATLFAALRKIRDA